MNRKKFIQTATVVAPLLYTANLLSQGGDKSMGPCSKTVRDMLAMCETLSKLATSNSEFTKKHATLCLEVCKKCEDECRKHPKHKVCMNCAESCKACSSEINKILG